MNSSFLRINRRSSAKTRRGVSAVECAILAPLFTLLVLGLVDVGQFANVYQKVSDASRAGARTAARFGTATTAQVEAAVMDYLEAAAPDVPPSTLAAATDVTVTGAGGAAIAGGSLTTLPTGTQIQVQVTLRYDPVRWINGISELNGSEITTTTMMRRE
jgi:Flp pilus assembly protein TadG